MNTPLETKDSKRCECGKGFVVMIRYGNGKPTQTCTHTIREYERQFGKSSAVIVRQP